MSFLSELTNIKIGDINNLSWSSKDNVNVSDVFTLMSEIYSYCEKYNKKNGITDFEEIFEEILPLVYLYICNNKVKSKKTIEGKYYPTDSESKYIECKTEFNPEENTFSTYEEEESLLTHDQYDGEYIPPHLLSTYKVNENVLSSLISSFTKTLYDNYITIKNKRNIESKFDNCNGKLEQLFNVHILELIIDPDYPKFSSISNIFDEFFKTNLDSCKIIINLPPPNSVFLASYNKTNLKIDQSLKRKLETKFPNDSNNEEILALYSVLVNNNLCNFFHKLLIKRYHFLYKYVWVSVNDNEEQLLINNPHENIIKLIENSGEEYTENFIGKLNFIYNICLKLFNGDINGIGTSIWNINIADKIEAVSNEYNHELNVNRQENNTFEKLKQNIQHLRNNITIKSVHNAFYGNSNDKNKFNKFNKNTYTNTKSIICNKESTEITAVKTKIKNLDLKFNAETEKYNKQLKNELSVRDDNLEKLKQYREFYDKERSLGASLIQSKLSNKMMQYDSLIKEMERHYKLINEKYDKNKANIEEIYNNKKSIYEADIDEANKKLNYTTVKRNDLYIEKINKIINNNNLMDKQLMSNIYQIKLQYRKNLKNTYNIRKEYATIINKNLEVNINFVSHIFHDNGDNLRSNLVNDKNILIDAEINELVKSIKELDEIIRNILRGLSTSEDKKPKLAELNKLTFVSKISSKKLTILQLINEIEKEDDKVVKLLKYNIQEYHNKYKNELNNNNINVELLFNDMEQDIRDNSQINELKAKFQEHLQRLRNINNDENDNNNVNNNITEIKRDDFVIYNPNAIYNNFFVINEDSSITYYNSVREIKGLSPNPIIYIFKDMSISPNTIASDIYNDVGNILTRDMINRINGIEENRYLTDTYNAYKNKCEAIYNIFNTLGITPSDYRKYPTVNSIINEYNRYSETVKSRSNALTSINKFKGTLLELNTLNNYLINNYKDCCMFKNISIKDNNNIFQIVNKLIDNVFIREYNYDVPPMIKILPDSIKEHVLNIITIKKLSILFDSAYIKYGDINDVGRNDENYNINFYESLTHANKPGTRVPDYNVASMEFIKYCYDSNTPTKFMDKITKYLALVYMGYDVDDIVKNYYRYNVVVLALTDKENNTDNNIYIDMCVTRFKEFKITQNQCVQINKLYEHVCNSNKFIVPDYDINLKSTNTILNNLYTEFCDGVSTYNSKKEYNDFFEYIDFKFNYILPNYNSELINKLNKINIDTLSSNNIDDDGFENNIHYNGRPLDILSRNQHNILNVVITPTSGDINISKNQYDYIISKIKQSTGKESSMPFDTIEKTITSYHENRPNIDKLYVLRSGMYSDNIPAHKDKYDFSYEDNFNIYELNVDENYRYNEHRYEINRFNYNNKCVDAFVMEAKILAFEYFTGMEYYNNTKHKNIDYQTFFIHVIKYIISQNHLKLFKYNINRRINYKTFVRVKAPLDLTISTSKVNINNATINNVIMYIIYDALTNTTETAPDKRRLYQCTAMLTRIYWMLDDHINRIVDTKILNDEAIKSNIINAFKHDSPGYTDDQYNTLYSSTVDIIKMFNLISVKPISQLEDKDIDIDALKRYFTYDIHFYNTFNFNIDFGKLHIFYPVLMVYFKSVLNYDKDTQYYNDFIDHFNKLTIDKDFNIIQYFEFITKTLEDFITEKRNEYIKKELLKVNQFETNNVDQRDNYIRNMSKNINVNTKYGIVDNLSNPSKLAAKFDEMISIKSDILDLYLFFIKRSIKIIMKNISSFIRDNENKHDVFIIPKTENLPFSINVKHDSDLIARKRMFSSLLVSRYLCNYFIKKYPITNSTDESLFAKNIYAHLISSSIKPYPFQEKFLNAIYQDLLNYKSTISSCLNTRVCKNYDYNEYLHVKDRFLLSNMIRNFVQIARLNYNVPDFRSIDIYNNIAKLNETYSNNKQTWFSLFNICDPRYETPESSVSDMQLYYKVINEKKNANEPMALNRLLEIKNDTIADVLSKNLTDSNMYSLVTTGIIQLSTKINDVITDINTYNKTLLLLQRTLLSLAVSMFITNKVNDVKSMLKAIKTGNIEMICAFCNKYNIKYNAEHYNLEELRIKYILSGEFALFPVITKSYKDSMGDYYQKWIIFDKFLTLSNPDETLINQVKRYIIELSECKMDYLHFTDKYMNCIYTKLKKYTSEFTEVYQLMHPLINFYEISYSLQYENSDEEDEDDIDVIEHNKIFEQLEPELLQELQRSNSLPVQDNNSNRRSDSVQDNGTLNKPDSVSNLINFDNHDDYRLPFVKNCTFYKTVNCIKAYRIYKGSIIKGLLDKLPCSDTYKEIYEMMQELQQYKIPIKLSPMEIYLYGMFVSKYEFENAKLVIDAMKQNISNKDIYYKLSITPSNKCTAELIDKEGVLDEYKQYLIKGQSVLESDTKYYLTKFYENLPLSTTIGSSNKSIIYNLKSMTNSGKTTLSIMLAKLITIAARKNNNFNFIVLYITDLPEVRKEIKESILELGLSCGEIYDDINVYDYKPDGVLNLNVLSNLNKTRYIISKSHNAFMYINKEIKDNNSDKYIPFIDEPTASIGTHNINVILQNNWEKLIEDKETFLNILRDAFPNRNDINPNHYLRYINDSNVQSQIRHYCLTLFRPVNIIRANLPFTVLSGATLPTFDELNRSNTIVKNFNMNRINMACNVYNEYDDLLVPHDVLPDENPNTLRYINECPLVKRLMGIDYSKKLNNDIIKNVVFKKYTGDEILDLFMFNVIANKTSQYNAISKLHKINEIYTYYNNSNSIVSSVRPNIPDIENLLRTNLHLIPSIKQKNLTKLEDLINKLKFTFDPSDAVTKPYILPYIYKEKTIIFTMDPIKYSIFIANTNYEHKFKTTTVFGKGNVTVTESRSSKGDTEEVNVNEFLNEVNIEVKNVIDNAAGSGNKFKQALSMYDFSKSSNKFENKIKGVTATGNSTKRQELNRKRKDNSNILLHVKKDISDTIQKYMYYTNNILFITSSVKIDPSYSVNEESLGSTFYNGIYHYNNPNIKYIIADASAAYGLNISGLEICVVDSDFCLDNSATTILQATSRVGREKHEYATIRISEFGMFKCALYSNKSTEFIKTSFHAKKSADLNELKNNILYSKYNSLTDRLFNYEVYTVVKTLVSEFALPSYMRGKLYKAAKGYDPKIDDKIDHIMGLIHEMPVENFITYKYNANSDEDEDTFYYPDDEDGLIIYEFNKLITYLLTTLINPSLYNTNEDTILANFETYSNKNGIHKIDSVVKN